MRDSSAIVSETLVEQTRNISTIEAVIVNRPLISTTIEISTAEATELVHLIST